MKRDWCTLIDALRWQAQHAGDSIVFTFLSGPREERISFAELDERARAAAVLLRERCAPGDRVMLIYPVGLRYIEAFFGCLYAGVIAVPAYPPHPTHASRGLSKFLGIVRDARPAALLTEPRLARMLSSLRERAPELDIPWITTTGDIDNAAAWTPPNVGGEDLAFLQYTSGSTADPKGVMLRHRNLLANLELICSTTPRKPGELVVSWLPPYHDMGLIGSILLPVYGGGPAVLMPPAAFLQRPLWWLETIARFRGTYGAAPDFAYDLCVRAVEQGLPEGLDLSSWTMFLDGAEPIRASTISNFLRAFAPAGVPANGLAPSYGLAEATLMVAVSDPAIGAVQIEVDPRELERKRVVVAAEGGKQLVSSGTLNDAWDIRIVDADTRRVLHDAEIGEIWLRGASVAAGYWEKPQLTRETFEAQLADGGDARFLRTGDLGFLNDGQLYVTGRLKEMICVRGRNLYPQDIERAIEPLAASTAGLHGACVAIGADVDGREEIVIFHELERRAAARRKASATAPADERRVRDRRSRRSPPRCGSTRAGRAEDALAIAIASAAAQQLEVRVAAVVLVSPGTLPRTSSGKSQRIACRRSFECDFSDGTLHVVHLWRPESSGRSASPVLARAPEPARVAAEADGWGDWIGYERSDYSYRELVDWLTARFAVKWNVAPDALDIQRPFVEFGLDSATAIEITAQLSEFVGQSLSPTLLWDLPNIDALACALARDRAGEAGVKPAERTRAPDAEGFAVVGMACKLPGADDVEAFWELLSQGRSGISERAVHRFRELGGVAGVEALGVPAHGGFVSDLDQFDAGFFSISAREAAEMDPQQRMLLEVGFHALEDSGVPPSRWAGSRTGVFVGISSSDYGMLAARNGRAADLYTGTGNAHSIAANRVSYAFDLRGPSLAVDSACSSSLLAVHLGCESLRRGESDSVVVAGVNAILSPLVTAAFCKAQMIAQDGRCKTFAADADGYVRGEGCAALVLKRLSDAKRDGDRIRAVIRGSAVVQDGRSNGLTAPNGSAQREVLRAALADARLEPNDIDYVEAHGTGTALGDPIETAALGSVFGSPAREKPWLLGAVKANIGHLEAAAGVAGLIKLVLCLERETVPPQLHATALNPRIDLEAMRARIPREPAPWLRGERVRRGGVSSFGFGGTNLHVVVEEAPTRAPQPLATEQPCALALSARSEPSLRQLSARVAARLLRCDDAEYVSVCQAASATRSEFPYKLALLARSRQQTITDLEAYAAAGAGVRVRTGTARKPSRIAFLFTGQGAQYPGMARELYAAAPAFREAIDRCAALLSGVLPLVELLIDEAADPNRLAETHITQPLMFSFQYALAELWRAWGVTPDVVLGHSLGEYAAWCAAGALSLSDALELVVKRATLMAALPHGAMAAVVAPEAQVKEALVAGQGRVSIAADNGPANIALSGPAHDVDAVVQQLTRQGVGVRRLAVSHAFHSAMMDPMLPAFESVLAHVRFESARAQIISNVSGAAIDPLEMSPRYFCEHTRAPVQFARGVHSLVESGVRQVIEIGPQPVLSNLIKRLVANQVETLPSLKQGLPARETLGTALGALHVAGHTVAWDVVYPAARAAASQLPAYPFDRQRHWLATHPSASPRRAEAAAPSSAVDPGVLHPLLDRLVEREATASVFEKNFTANDLALAQHVVQSIPILPGVAYVEAMLAAARWHLGRPALRVENVLIVSPLAMGEAGGARMIVSARSESAAPERVQLRVTSQRADGSEIQHASCECVGAIATPSARLDLEALQSLPSQRLDADLMYAAFRRVGIEYGEFFRSVRWVDRGDRETLALLELSPAAAAQTGYLLHPALLDAALQSFAALISDSQDVTQLYVPLSMGHVELRSALGSRVYVHARRTDSGTSATLPELVRGSLSITDERGLVLASIEEFSLKRVRLERSIAEMIRSQAAGPSVAQTALTARKAELAQEQTRLRALYAIESYAGVGPVVAALCTRYVIDALAALGCAPKRGAVIDPAGLAATFALTPPHRKLLDRMLQMLEEDGACARDAAGVWVWTEDDTRARPPTIDELLQRSPACSAELTLLRRCGESLSAALRGDVTPLELLFPDGSMRLAEALYQESPFARYYNGVLASAVRQIAAGNDGRRLRVLEIGAGTGGTTAYALPALAGFEVQYVFSDVSRLFLAMAEKKFRGYAGLEYALLDLERAPHEQGFEPASFDLIIAANVLHATADIGRVLEHVRWLLPAHGTLVLLEGTGRQRATDLIFGLTDGWWRFQDERLEAGYPLLSRERWLALLLSKGFSGAATLTESDEATTWCEQLVIAAEADSVVRELPRATRAPAREPAPPARERVHAPGGAASTDAAAEARRLIVAELAAALGAAPEAVDLEQNFLDMGLDSLMAMEILAKLKSGWGINVPPTVLFEHTNTLALAQYLAERHGERLLQGHVNGAARESKPAAAPIQTRVVAKRPAPEGDAIAIIGMACRFPGASSVDAFWQLLVDGRDMIGPIPVERWDTRQSGGCAFGGMLERIDGFDPLFFEISPREARLIDPQQRLFLEVAWEAVEHAGSVVTGTNTGVFVGCTNADYFDRIKPFLTLDDYAAGLGNKNCIIPNRVSYVMNLRGPSVLVDTACSSSLVAMHMALQSLRRGDCSQAIVGGVNVLLSPLYYLALNRMGVQAPDGRCKAFDHRADGFASGEGAGAVVLKPLARALADGDHVYAIVKGSAVNHDGRSAGLAAPNPAAHAELIAAAYRDAAVSPDSVSYIEAHGTGTALGDPIEIDGLTRAFRESTQRTGYCAIGSVKTNIGHLEPAAGIAGVIKTVLCLQHRYLPSSLHFERPNPHIAFDETPFVVNATGRPWKHSAELRAGVSSFGMGGTNAHVVLAEAPPPAARPVLPSGVWILALSARTAPALRALVERYADHLQSRPSLRLEDVCFTAAAGRVAMKHRLAVIAQDRSELLRALMSLREDLAWTNLDPRRAARGTGKAVGRGSVDIVHAGRAEAEQAALAYAQGAPVHAESGLARAARKTALPSYPFEHVRCWVDGPSAPLPAAVTAGPVPAQPQTRTRDSDGAARPVAPALLDLHSPAPLNAHAAPCYALAWREVSPPSAAAEGAGGWLVIGRSAIAAALSAALVQKGRACWEFSDLQATRAAGSADADLQADIARFVRERRVTRVVYVCDGADLAARECSVAEPLSAALHALSCVSRALTATSARIWVLTRSAHAFGALEEDRPEHAAFWSFGVALALDLPKVWGGLIDTSPVPEPSELEHVLVEIESGDEDQVAWRAGVRRVPRLVPHTPSSLAGAWALNAGAAYLVTGGLGGLGLEVARRLAERGARSIVLLGRSANRAALDATTHAKLRAIEDSGARVSVWKGDVADAAAMSSLAARFGAELPRLAGIVHCAGVVQLGAAVEQSRQDLAAVTRPKIDGTLVLESVFPPATLDFFVCFSSGASIWGSRGLAAYAAGSGFLDGWARSRARRGAKASSLNWGMWAHVGMSSDEERAGLLSAIGLRAMEPAAALCAMEQALLDAAPQRVVTDIDWSTFRRVYEAHAPRRKLLCEVEGAAPPRDASSGAAVGRASLAQTRAAVRSLLAQLTNLPDDALDSDAPLNTLGIDSISALDLQVRLVHEFGCKIEVAEIVQGATVDDVVDQIWRRTGGWKPSAEPVRGAIPKRAAGAPPCMSSPQERLWFLEQLAPGAAIYNVPGVIRVRSALDARELQRAFQLVLARHEVLRTGFEVRDGTPVPVLHEHVELPCEFRDLSERAANWEALARQEVRKPFDLARAPLLRLLVLRLAPADHVVVMTMHHIVADAWSLGVLVRELAAMQVSARNGATFAQPPLPIQFSDYAAWQRARIDGGELAAGLAYWVRELRDAPRLLELPLDLPRPAVRTGQGALATFRLPADVAEALRSCAKQHAVTPFVVCLAMYAAMLQKYSRQSSVCVGVPVAGRQEPETHPLIGFFVNTIVLRVDFDEGLDVRTLLSRVMAASASGLAHQDVPFEQVVAALRPPRSASHTPLFQAGLAFQNVPTTARSIGNHAFEMVELDPGVSKFDLHLTIHENEGTYEGSLEYSTDVFEAATAERMLRHFSNLLRQAARHPELRVDALSLAGAQEREQVLEVWNRTDTDFGSPELLHRLIEAQAARTPERTAVSFGSTSLTYADLDRRANRLAWRLRHAGIGPGDFVGVFMERSAELVVALFAILKSGGAYVPFDPSYPRARLEFLARDADARLILSHEPLRQRAWSESTWFVDLAGLVDGDDAGSLPDAATPDDPAYMIYTSGSTGNPKGALNSHRAICNRLSWMQAEMALDATDKVLQKTPIGFDVSVWELFWPLIAGARQILAEPGGHLDAGYLAQLIASERVTTLHFVPSMLQTFLEQPELPRSVSLRRVICSGEALPRALHDRCLRVWPHVNLYNLYGPTEAAVDVSVWKCSLDDGRRDVSIGRPIANTRLYVLDRAMNPLPAGVPGELCIGGVQVGLGYHLRPELTREKFVRDAFGAAPGARLYRTGDLARWRDDGTLDYLGRVDQQIKLHGCRIEPGEIEAALCSQPSVAEAAVVVRVLGEAAGLVAYVVPSDARASSEGLQRALRAVLPEFMVPSLVVLLPALPRSPNGKLDRQALPVPEHRPSSDLVRARDDVERQVAALWCELLGRADIGVQDNFFEVGGHSLLATRLAARMSQRFDTRVSVAALLAAPTVAKMAAVVRGAADGGDGITLEFGPASAAPSLFLVHPAGGDASCYRWIASRVQSRVRVVGLRSPALTGGRLHADVPSIAQDYVRALRKSQPMGPYWLGGWSMGGVVAFEMAKQLCAAGEQVRGLVLIDSLFPSPAAHAAVTEESLLRSFARDLAAMFGVDAPSIDAAASDHERWIEALHVACVDGLAGAAPTRAEIALRMKVYVEHCKAMLAYRPARLPVRLALVLSQEGARAESAFGSWSNLSDCVFRLVVDADHYSLLDGPHAASVTRAIQRILDAPEPTEYAARQP